MLLLTIAWQIANGTITTVAGNGTPGMSGDGGPAVNASLDLPMGVALDASGNLFIADSNNNTVRRVDKQGVISTLPGTMGLLLMGTYRKRRRQAALLCCLIVLVALSTWACGGSPGNSTPPPGQTSTVAVGELLGHSYCKRGRRSGAFVDASYSCNSVAR